MKQSADHKSTPLKLGQLPHILEEAWPHASTDADANLALPDVYKEGDELVMLASSKFTAGLA